MSANRFNRFATYIARKTGHPSAFGLAVVVVGGWAITGPMFDFSDTWQLAINTSTTIVTFLMVFLIQNTQSRDSAATQMKLDELIRVTIGAHNMLLDVEERSDEELSVLRDHFTDIAHHARARVKVGMNDTDAG